MFKSDLLETFYNAELVISFLNEPYTAMESDGGVFVYIGVISGNLQRELTFQLTLTSGSALGNLFFSSVS